MLVLITSAGACSSFEVTRMRKQMKKQDNDDDTIYNYNKAITQWIKALPRKEYLSL